MGGKENVLFHRRDSDSLPPPFPFAAQALNRKVGELVHAWRQVQRVRVDDVERFGRSTVTRHDPHQRAGLQARSDVPDRFKKMPAPSTASA
jgi:hypothetical protein